MGKCQAGTSVIATFEESESSFPMKNAILFVVVIFLLTMAGVSGCQYNRMITMLEDVHAKWAQVESQYQRRTDLYNSVISVVEGSAEFERKTLNEVIDARARATSFRIDPNQLSPESLANFQQVQDQFASAFSRLLLVMEQYPQLQTTQQFRDFQVQIEGTENRINKARDDFNLSVQNYNAYTRRFPNNMIAGLFGFKPKGYFAAAPATSEPPPISFELD